MCKPIDYPNPDGVLTFDRLSSVFLANLAHEENQPDHLVLNNPQTMIDVNYKEYASPETRYCPAGVYEIIEETAVRACKSTRQTACTANLRHQRPDAKHHLDLPRRRKRTELRRDVNLIPPLRPVRNKEWGSCSNLPRLNL
ncbi:electron transfer flavoprotein-ubiquinone oxidoreductase [Neisseria gonorrhoeae]|nr:electron transfer flavoprotein-ubiquinone oxidoreductase [Neisseria gonorrhoeae]